MHAIVPAYNEEQTVADVVSVLVQSGRFSRVLCVDDGSKDRTSERAEAAGAQVLRMRRNGGKGQAMLAAARQCAKIGGVTATPAIWRSLTPT